VNSGVVEVSHQPFTFCLTPGDFCIFSEVKAALKGRRFHDVEGIKNVTTELHSVSLVTWCNFINKRKSVLQSKKVNFEESKTVFFLLHVYLFDVTGQLLIIYSAFVKYLRKNGNTVRQGISYV
jgi:hypothetical protein